MLKAPIIGREEEIKILEDLLHSPRSELLAIYGRRRVGKTFLIKTYYDKHITFSCSGQSQAKTQEQLINFSIRLATHFTDQKLPMPGTWQRAFYQLEECLNTLPGTSKKKVIFFDEIPWLETPRSRFLSAFGYFWNMYATKRSDLIVVICGSAASWIINKVLGDKGGLHNRVTQRIRLLPFTINETENYLRHRNIKLERYQLLQLYMVMGGIPQYLNAFKRGDSVNANIEKICFSKDGALTNEFGNLYAALFNHPGRHIQIIKALAQKNKGLTRNELIKASKLFTGGTMTVVLNELTESGFIDKIYPFGKQQKNSLYRLSDEFSLFYLRFMQHAKTNKKGNWQEINSSVIYANWCGYAFENICFKHIEQIKKGIGIADVLTSYSSWQKTGSKEKPGAQIDLVIERADKIINLCEMKFSSDPFVIAKKYAEELKNKMRTFRMNYPKNRKSLFLTMITTYGVVNNDYKVQLIDKAITMDTLFE